ncbi:MULTISPECIES: hypothetical protein [Bacillales]|uniref:hypothetical protein n=1 Tax=Bacillales TaxID=1385 RepID=UPI0006A7782A|nr:MULTISPECIES: hypothetical protein [Bacillales]OBZ17040.1 hypothetical protein A7975_03875 [Bacillus sp. FJAT-26390]
MNKFHRLSIAYLFVGVVFVIGGMSLKSALAYSPLIGWILGLASFLTSTYYASKAKKDED